MIRRVALLVTFTLTACNGQPAGITTAGTTKPKVGTMHVVQVFNPPLGA
jgi:hypothetical protein